MTITTVETFNEMIDEFADPRVKQWNFMGSPLPTLVIIGMYLTTVLQILPHYMKGRKAFRLIGVIRMYNILQILLCLTLLYKITFAGYAQGKYNWGCQPVDYSNDYYALQLLNVFYLNYFVKMLEFLETAFFVLRKKFNQVTGLHVYHHASTFFLSWIGCKFIGGGMSTIPVMLNTFIHVLMYSYYYLSSLGPEWQKQLAPWKPKLTMLQMVQFTIMILHALIALNPSCNVPKHVLLIYVPNVVLIYKMFYDFYQNSYLKKNAVKGAKKTKKVKS